MVETEMSVELFRQESEEYRSINLCVNTDASVCIDAHAMGPTVQQLWGDSDQEFAVIVPGTAVPKLVLSTPAERLARRC